MIEIRRATDRGHARHGWLESRHTFSFADYHDPQQMGFRALRVINEDRVAPGRGFDAHSHRDMEILSVVLEGALEHRDSLGHGSVIRPGEVQLMRAGTGVTHSEYNPSQAEPVRFLQIWILPAEGGVQPSYEQKALPESERANRLCLVASHDGREGSLQIGQDVAIYVSQLDAGAPLTEEIGPDRHAWVQVIRGVIRLNGEALVEGDGAALSQEPELRIEAETSSELLLFDLA
jgi:redox-sensitive bicupin YhaK (pirin superfamily)